MQQLQIEQRRDPAAVEAILRSLPQWFGDEQAIRNYVDAARRLDSFLAMDAGTVVGVALVERHFAESAELALIAVYPDRRGEGLGRALVDAAAVSAESGGAKLLQVRTVGPSFEDEGYAQTRAFYRTLGFLPVQEFTGIDWDGPTLILVKVLGSQG